MRAQRKQETKLAFMGPNKQQPRYKKDMFPTFERSTRKCRSLVFVRTVFLSLLRPALSYKVQPLCIALRPYICLYRPLHIYIYIELL